MRLKKFIALGPLAALGIQPINSHAGGLDTTDCHSNRKTFAHHCYRTGDRTSITCIGVTVTPAFAELVSDQVSCTPVPKLPASSELPPQSQWIDAVSVVPCTRPRLEQLFSLLEVLLWKAMHDLADGKNSSGRL